ncbi:MAG TPA: primosomal protein N', partial [Gammaproteobacteria bacterium]|nr:primosomal protein N' [Gammaproteobacteria bacterium]
SQLKNAFQLLDNMPIFPSNYWLFLNKAHRYYHHPLGEILITGMPLALRKGEPLAHSMPLTKNAFVSGENQQPSFNLNPEQKNTLDHIRKCIGRYQTFLLEGVTGSGKTEIYRQLIQTCQKQNQSVLVLLPEIALTPQTLARFQQGLSGNLLIYHSKLSQKTRVSVWAHIKNNPNSVVIGTRSALFLPFEKLGAIIVDEEHDPSFKQQEGFKYSARDLAVLRAQIDQCPIVLGSATPSFESIFNANVGKYKKVVLSTRANQQILPKIQIIDIRHKQLKDGLSNHVIESIRSHLHKQYQVLIFLNRRGYAPVWMCYTCGHIAQCERCDVKLTFHKHKSTLICHHCNKKYSLIEKCVHCQNSMLEVGVGTERLEIGLQELFPEIPIVRIDSDTTRKKGVLSNKLQQIHESTAQILIGTQLLAKGHHFPNVTLVAIVDVDAGLFSNDFRSAERMGQLITQVAGRAGRESLSGEVLLQTTQPEHPYLNVLIEQGYGAFASALLQERKQTLLPPYCSLAMVRASAQKNVLPEQFLTKLKHALTAVGTIDVWGPFPSSISRKQGYYRYHLMLQAATRNQLHRILAKLNGIILTIPESKKVRWSLDVDPIEMG